MKAKHTPGPWHVKPTSYPERAHPQVYAGNKRIAEPCNSQDVPAPESDANAYLIAAAPWLLEACEALIRDSEVRPGAYIHARGLDEIRAAIAKATQTEASR